MSEVTPMALERDRDDKEHAIELKLEGHTTVKRTLKYDEGIVTKVKERLTGKGAKIEVNSEPEELEVMLDGAKVGETPLTVDVAVGEHRVAITGKDRETVEETITVAKDETKKIKHTVPKKGQMATVAIDTSPRAEIWVNGRSTGKWTGDGPVQLAPNIDHRVTLKAGKRDGEIVVKLKKGETKRIFLDLGGA
jgi:hypothetical protein